jgi:hypothetical protein
MKLTPLAIAITAIFINSVNANEVEESGVTTFTTGTPAIAAEVNDNFGALITAINDNATRISALENSNRPITSAADLNGTLYCIHDLVVDVGAADLEHSGDPDYIQGWRSAGVGTTSAGQVLFSSNTQGTFTITASDYYEQSHPLSENPGEENGVEIFSFTYSTPLLTLTFTEDGETDSYTGTLSADGNMFFITNSETDSSHDDTGTFGSGSLTIGVRAESCMPSLP